MNKYACSYTHVNKSRSCPLRKLIVQLRMIHIHYVICYFVYLCEHEKYEVRRSEPVRELSVSE